MDPKWVDWARRLHALGNNGLLYAETAFERERYSAVQEIAAEIIANGTSKQLPYVRDLLDRESGWITPKVDVRGAVFRDNQILLIRQHDDGLWSLPGGYADVDESPSEAVMREVREETGYQVRVDRILAVYDHNKHPHSPPVLYRVYKLFFSCSIIGGGLNTGFEAIEQAFFEVDILPELSRNRVTGTQIGRLVELHRRGDLKTEFD